MPQQKVFTLNTGYQPRPERDAEEVARKIQEQALLARSHFDPIFAHVCKVYELLKTIEALATGEGGQR